MSVDLKDYSIVEDYDNHQFEKVDQNNRTDYIDRVI